MIAKIHTVYCLALLCGACGVRTARAQALIPLGDLFGGHQFSTASGVSADGSTVVGYSNSANGQEAFRWASGGGMVGLGDLPGGSFYSQAQGVSADGSTVVGFGSSASGFAAFVWREGVGMNSLVDLLLSEAVDPSADGWAELTGVRGVSADGRYVVGYGTRNGAAEAFLADLGRWRSRRLRLGPEAQFSP